MSGVTEFTGPERSSPKRVSEILPEIQNVVVSATLGQEMDLNSIVRVFPATEYHPETFPGLIFRLKKPRATALIFRSGKMICAGAKSERQAKRAVSNILDELKRNGIVIVNKPTIEIQNIVATASLGGMVDLEKTAYALERTIYDPEQFPGLIYRMTEPKVVILIFASGNLVCAGARKEQDVVSATRTLEGTLQQKELISYERRDNVRSSRKVHHIPTGDPVDTDPELDPIRI